MSDSLSCKIVWVIHGAVLTYLFLIFKTKSLIYQTLATFENSQQTINTYSTDNFIINQ